MNSAPSAGIQGLRAGAAISATLILLGGPALTAGPATADTNGSVGSVRVIVQGLPTQKTFTTGPRIKVVGPVAHKKSKSWSVSVNGRTIRRVKPGMYYVSARYAKTADDNAYQPAFLTKWVRGGAAGRTTVRLTYVSLGEGLIIPPPMNPEVQIDMNDACRYLTGDPKSTAWYRSNSDPASWYCASGGRESGMDLNAYCRWKYEDTYRWQSHNKRGMEWWCYGF